jgi:hypothetical protein
VADRHLITLGSGECVREWIKDTRCAARTIAERGLKDVCLAGSGFHASESIRKRRTDTLLSANGKGEREGNEHSEGKEHLERKVTERKLGS